jgi:hypothetical protein
MTDRVILAGVLVWRSVALTGDIGNPGQKRGGLLARHHCPTRLKKLLMRP